MMRENWMETFEDQRLGEALWDPARDRRAIRAYAQAALAEMEAQAVGSRLMAPVPSSGPQLLQILSPQGTRVSGQVHGAMRVASGVQALAQINSTDALSAALAGASAGMGVAGGLAQLGVLSAVPGVGWVAAGIGAVAGLFQSHKARERQEALAERVRQQMLDQLRLINNALQPVSDYFRRGTFGTLPPSSAFGMSAEQAWAVQGRRGVV